MDPLAKLGVVVIAWLVTYQRRFSVANYDVVRDVHDAGVLVRGLPELYDRIASANAARYRHDHRWLVPYLTRAAEQKEVLQSGWNHT